MHTLLGGDEGSECDDVWPCLLLDVYWGLGTREARVSALQAGLSGAACSAAARIDMSGMLVDYV